MNRKDIAKFIGVNLQKARLCKHMTQEELAELCDVTPKYISAIERGRSGGSVTLLINICNILNVSIDSIIDSTLVSNSNNYPNMMDAEILIQYYKLKDENKNFVDYTIEHLHYMQKER